MQQVPPSPRPEEIASIVWEMNRSSRGRRWVMGTGGSRWRALGGGREAREEPGGPRGHKGWRTHGPRLVSDSEPYLEEQQPPFSGRVASAVSPAADGSSDWEPAAPSMALGALSCWLANAVLRRREEGAVRSSAVLNTVSSAAAAASSASKAPALILQGKTGEGTGPRRARGPIAAKGGGGRDETTVLLDEYISEYSGSVWQGTLHHELSHAW
ncbi:UNVERIFIED_CONTAM: hypothetical protein K2H54_048295 [Gekko kuhli]